MTPTWTQVLNMVRDAYHEGFTEGGREHSTWSGGKPWPESNAYKAVCSALEASALSSKRKWDEGEHEGCGIDSQRAYEKEKSEASTLSSQHHNTAQGE